MSQSSFLFDLQNTLNSLNEQFRQITINANSTLAILSQNPLRHYLEIQNLSPLILKYGDKNSQLFELSPFSRVVYKTHLALVEVNDILVIIPHADWDSDLYIKNESSTDNATIVVKEVY